MNGAPREYSYRARDPRGTLVAGSLEATSDAACLEVLARRELVPVRIAASESTSARARCRDARDVGDVGDVRDFRDVGDLRDIGDVDVHRRSKTGRRRGGRERAGRPSAGAVRDRDLVFLTKQLAGVQDAGLPLVEGLRLVESSFEGTALGPVVGSVARDVEGGTELAEAFAAHPAAFPPVFLDAIRAGQESGSLATVLTELQEHLEERVSIRRELVGALRYPATVLATLVLGVGVVFAVVLPRLAPLHARLGDDLPSATRGLLAARSLVVEHGAGAGIALGLAAVGAMAAARTARGRALLDRERFRIPGVGRIARDAALSRFAAAMATLGASGGSMVRNLDVAAGAMASRFAEDQVRAARERIVDGSSLSDALGRQPFFPPSFVRIVRVGERSGRLDDWLRFLARHHRDESRHRARDAVAAVEPFLTLVAGALILYLALAVFLPYWNMIRAFRGEGGA